MGSLLRLTTIILDLIAIFGALVLARSWHLGIPVPLALWVLEGVLVALAVESYASRRWQRVTPLATEPQIGAAEDV